VRRFATLAFLLFLFSIPLWLGNFYLLHVLIITGIFIIAAMSLNLLLGYTGQLSLGHAAFFGIGAYVSSLVSLGFEVHLLPDWLVTLDPQPVWFGMACAIVITGLCGWGIGRIAFKVRGAYFVIVTISFAEVVRLVALNWDELTQGPMALNNIPPLSVALPGFVDITFIGKVANYYLVLVFAVIAYVIAGAAGALYAHYVRIVDPNVFLFIYTVTMVIMVVAGGKGTLAGPVVGGVIFGLLPEGLRSLAIAPEVQWIVYGVLMILVVYLLPQGIVPALRAFRQRSQRLDAETAPHAGASAGQAVP
jgi:branched-chain amino acid transport system permease protein